MTTLWTRMGVLACVAGTVPAGMVPGEAASAQPQAAIGARISTHKADVDGDGRLDTVTVTRTSAETTRLSVRTARGRTASVAMEYLFAYEPKTPFRGAADLDGVRGKELVILTTTGAHTGWHEVLTWRDGKIYRLRNPWNRQSAWPADGYAGGGLGYTVTGRGSAMRLIIEESTCSMAGGYRCTVDRRVHAWKGGAWKQVSRTVKTRSTSGLSTFAIRGITPWFNA